MKVDVELGARSYPIWIEPGALGRDILSRIRTVTKASRLYVVTDENVASHYAGHFAGEPLIVLPAGEATKSFAHYRGLCEEILSRGIDRGSVLVALGGGVIGDLVGFVAATLMRGIAFVQVPTTLLAQVDSSVGGKTAIDTPQGKNLVGAFHQPRCVIIDPETLTSLPERHVRAGYAEIVKYGLIEDAGFFAWLQANGGAVLGGDVIRQQEAIATCCRMKADVVAEDEHEEGRRALLNLGHTFGHAVEKLNDFDESILHGEAIAAGMCLAFALSQRLGLCRGDEVQQVVSHIAGAGLPTRLSQFDNLPRTAEPYLDAMRGDKKVSKDQIVFILARGIGQAFIASDVPLDAVSATIAESLAPA